MIDGSSTTVDWQTHGGEVTLRAMRHGDIGAGMRLSALAGWNQTEADWELFLRGNRDGCFAAVHDGRLVGTVGTITYEERLAWIGLVLVDPQFRRMGIGSLLMDRALKHLQGCPTVKLDASETGRKLYSTLGFVDEFQLQRLTHGSVPVLSAPVSGDLLPLTQGVLERMMELDRKVFGADRGKVIQSLLKNTPESAFWLERQGRIGGYCLGRSGSKFHQIGPVVAESAEDARSLVQAVLQKFGGRPVVLDVPEAQSWLLAWLGTLGFARERSFVRMFLNANHSPGIPAEQFAIAGPELG